MYVIEIELPDGFHWFGGIFINQIKTEKGVINMPYTFWTPYEKEAIKFQTQEQPEIAHKEIIEENFANVVHVSNAKFQYAYIEIGKGYFLGPKRQFNLQVGDKFKTEITANYYFEVTEIHDKTAICRKRAIYSKHKKHTVRVFEFSLKSKKFIYVIYEKNRNRIGIPQSN